MSIRKKREASGQPPKTFTERVVGSLSWTFVGRIAGRSLQLIKFIVLARLLTPEDFGLFGIAMLALALMETFSSTVFEKALIQRQDNVSGFLNVAWTVQISRGVIFASVLFLSAPYIAGFFQESQAVPILRMLCLIEIAKGSKNIGIVYFQKNLEFRKQAIYEVFGHFIGLVTGVILALQTRSVWALVWASLAAEFSRTILSYFLHPYRPSLSMNWNQVSQLFQFGKWLLGGSIVGLLAQKADRFILGRLLGAAALGFYNMADQIGGMLPTEFTHMTNVVMMPAYAKVQNEKTRLGRGFLQFFEVTLIIVGPLCAFIFIAAPEIVLALLGDAWQEMIAPLKILVIGGYLRSVLGTSAPLFLGTGYPSLNFWKSLIRATVTLALLYPLTINFGISGTAWAAVLGVAALSPLCFFTVKITKVSLSSLIKKTIPGVLLILASGVGASAGKAFSPSPLFSLISQTIVSGFFIFIVIFVLAKLGLGPWLQAKTSLIKLIPLLRCRNV